MPSENNKSSVINQITEKPSHYTYLKDFRVNQCQLFLQHKCTQHRPYTCFDWHFQNQRRRRPMRKRDGTFNYSPDIYCDKFDETTGVCPIGEECPFLHRTAGDTERRYHLRYFKTATCVHETDSKGHCMKNGPHCAFAHGADDLRPPVLDVREMKTLENGVAENVNSISSSLEKDRLLNDDPRWNDTQYVLDNYKTEQCKRPPRLCRQGFACPQYHNARDRRRNPKLFKYRSTPCPNVKHGDEWGDPSNCENGDECFYCHTRTEQQFHPEIYKSSKCHDMQQTGYCPRGPFCAFAHLDQEMKLERTSSANGENTLSNYIDSALPKAGNKENDVSNESSSQKATTSDAMQASMEKSIEEMRSKATPIPEPIGAGRSNSFSKTLNSTATTYAKVIAPARDEVPSGYKIPFQTLDLNTGLDQNFEFGGKPYGDFLGLSSGFLTNGYTNGLNGLSHGTIFNRGPSEGVESSFFNPHSSEASMPNPHASPFQPGGGDHSVVGKAIEDLEIDDLDASKVDKELDHDSNSVNSLNSNLNNSAGFMGASSIPVPNIPSKSSIGLDLFSDSPLSPLDGLPPPFIPQYLQEQHKQEQKFSEAQAVFMRPPNPGSILSTPPTGLLNGNVDPALLVPSINSLHTRCAMESQRLRHEADMYKNKFVTLEERMRSTCDHYKKEADEFRHKFKQSEESRKELLKQLDELINVKNDLAAQLESTACVHGLHLRDDIDLHKLPRDHLIHLQHRLQNDAKRVESVLNHSKTS